MARETFTWAVSSQEQTAAPRVIKTQFGDGYSQRTADGINNVERSWSFSSGNKRGALADEIDAFLARHGGWKWFWWTPHRQTTPVKVTCEDWKKLEGMGRLASVSGTFKEVFDPGD